MEWIVANKQWLFGGVLIAVPLAVVGWLLASRSASQRQKGGSGSTNVQVGGDFTVNQRSNDD